MPNGTTQSASSDASANLLTRYIAEETKAFAKDMDARYAAEIREIIKKFDAQIADLNKKVEDIRLLQPLESFKLRALWAAGTLVLSSLGAYLLSLAQLKGVLP